MTEGAQFSLFKKNFYTKRITLNEKKKKQKKARIDRKNSIWTKTVRRLRLD